MDLLRKATIQEYPLNLLQKTLNIKKVIQFLVKKSDFLRLYCLVDFKNYFKIKIPTKQLFRNLL